MSAGKLSTTCFGACVWYCCFWWFGGLVVVVVVCVHVCVCGGRWASGGAILDVGRVGGIWCLRRVGGVRGGPHSATRTEGGRVGGDIPRDAVLVVGGRPVVDEQ